MQLTTPGLAPAADGAQAVPHHAPPVRPLPPAVARALAIAALALLALGALYHGTAASLVAIWNSSETFTHGYVILPISLWLVWRRRAVFALHPPRPCWPALALLALAGAGWLLARMGEVQVVMQYAFVAMLPLAALALFGATLARALTFPLLFLLFAVPFGEVFMDALINFTADFTVWALQATGIPVLRSGNQFEIPSGNWSVVEACSGLRYLVSSITLGCLYAYLTYYSTRRRLAFIALSVVVPIIANGLRAYMIVMLGHHSGMTLAVGVDHLIYGWLFFGLVMLLMFWVGGRWREDEPPAGARAEQAAAEARTALPVRAGAMAAMAAAVVAVAGLWPAAAAYYDRVNFNPNPPRLAPALAAPAAAPFTRWLPAYMAADATVRQTHLQDGAPVAVHLLYYRNQRNGKSLISSTNRLTSNDDDAGYHVVSSGQRAEQAGGGAFAVREARVKGPDGELLVWHWMRVGEHDTTNNYTGKLWQAWSKLAGRGDDGAAVLLATPLTDSPDAARATLRAFLRAQLPALDAALDQARAR
ncbi:exosortase A [Pseudoduganella namucuonensis]|uniref:Exosortase A n=1 Tax=Pseudoduganella namucuonensis TaxID=1035707 RepID=A0A1I7GFJ6_9BURK|nr:exosortase A [Pseudoduganella namucuonensis]SFU47173.1 exosortase A [Pseudoduganella namucuonensis]